MTAFTKKKFLPQASSQTSMEKLEDC